MIHWFDPSLTGGSRLLMGLQLCLGSAVMGGLVSALGNLLVNRHAIRWGVIVPLIVMVVGSVGAVIAHKAGAFTLFLGTPLLAGIAVATGLLTSFYTEGSTAEE